MSWKKVKSNQVPRSIEQRHIQKISIFKIISNTQQINIKRGQVKMCHRGCRSAFHIPIISNCVLELYKAIMLMVCDRWYMYYNRTIALIFVEGWGGGMLQCQYFWGKCKRLNLHLLPDKFIIFSFCWRGLRGWGRGVRGGGEVRGGEARGLWVALLSIK